MTEYDKIKWEKIEGRQETATAFAFKLQDSMLLK